MKAILFALAMSAASLLAAEPSAVAVNQLGLDLQRQLTEGKGSGNLCLSPYSIQTALAMTYAGAAGETREEMAKVLHYPQGDAIHASISGLREALGKAQAKTVEMAAGGRNEKKGDPMTLQVANRLFGQQGFEFKEPFLKLLQDSYQAPLEPLDFAQSAAAAKHINGWVEKQTKDRIKDLISPEALGADTRLVLVNAVYLKVPWAKEFSKEATKPKPFAIDGGDTKDVPTMQKQSRYGYAERDGYRAVSLPYYGNDLQFLVLLPKAADGLPALEKKLTAEALASCAKLETKDVILSLPKFKLEPPVIPLSKSLKAMGMKKAFDQPAGSADFTGMAPRDSRGGLFISEVVHKTFFALDEKGTEAAAATAVMMVGASAQINPAAPIEVKVDRPFLFAIQHIESGACLFLGRVTDPR